MLNNLWLSTQSASKINDQVRSRNPVYASICGYRKASYTRAALSLASGGSVAENKKSYSVFVFL